MRIEIWSDVVCPWCFIGKRRFERALEQFRERRGPDAPEVEVVLRSFELDPTAPAPATERMDEVLARKYGGGLDNARAMMARVTEVAATEGLEYHLEDTLRGSTVDAHRLLHLALDDGGPRLQATLNEALMTAYFTHGQDVSDPAVLRKAAADAGLPADRVDAVLASGEYADAVTADVDQARALGVSGVPFFVADRAYAASGAQPLEVFTQLLERAWAASRPAPVAVGGSDEAGVCGPDGCY